MNYSLTPAQRAIHEQADGSTRRSDRFFQIIVFAIGLSCGLLVMGVLHPPERVVVEESPIIDDALCAARLGTWLYTDKTWVAQQERAQWQGLKTRLGECVR